MLMMHGFARNATFWNRWVPAIAESRRIYRPDLLGCGASDVPAPGYHFTPEKIAAEILAVFDGDVLERVHWVGESSGGIIGLLLAAAHPERIASLVLCNTPTRIPDEIKGIYALDRESTAAAIRAHGTGEWCRRTLGYRLDIEHASEALREWCIAEMDKTRPDIAAALHECFEADRYKAAALEDRCPGVAAQRRQKQDRFRAAENSRRDPTARPPRAVCRVWPWRQPAATRTLCPIGTRFLARGRSGPKMKLGVLQFFSWPERRVDLATVYARALERIEIMDRTGYDAVWLAEHHFSSFSVCPSVHMVGTLAAARTKRLRIGTAVSLAPFYHPLRLAEEVALLDLLSGGRVNWGAGRGFARVEFTAFGVPPEESVSRFHETVEIVLKAWTDAKLTFSGKHFHFEDVEVLPRPVQQPHPPVWVAVSSEGAIDWAAGRGFSVLMDPHSSGPEIGAKRRYYSNKLAAAGFSETSRDIPIARLVAIADNTGKAAEVARNGAEWIVNSYLGAQHRPVMTQNFWSAGVDPIRRYLDEVIVHGTPDKVGDEILQLREEIGLDYLLCAPLSHQSFMLLTEKVLPRLP